MEADGELEEKQLRLHEEEEGQWGLDGREAFKLSVNHRNYDGDPNLLSESLFVCVCVCVRKLPDIKPEHNRSYSTNIQ